MKTKNLFSTFLVLAFLLTACGQGTAAPVPVTQTPVMTQPPTDIPTQTATPYFIPLEPTSLPSPTAMPPYPTASTVKANAVAFIAGNSLWVANVDGSGERKLVDIANNERWVSNLLLQWSPDGKWISYFSGDELWIVSSDGLINKKVLPFTDLYTYVWSPDGSKIGYIQNKTQTDEGWPITVGILDLATEKVSEVSSHVAPDPMPISWSPNGHYLLFTKISAFVVFDVNAWKVVKEIKSNSMSCWLGWNTWSPNSKWFSYSYDGSMCISGLDGSTWMTPNNGVWDKTGNFLYSVVVERKSDGTPNTDVTPLLMRYEVSTQITEKLLSLEWDSQQDLWSISLSPNGNTLALRGCTVNSTQCSYIIIDIPSLFIADKFIVDFGTSTVEMYYPYPAWSSDNRNIIFFTHENGSFYEYGSFYAVDTKTGKATIISGKHAVEDGAISPIATTP